MVSEVCIKIITRKIQTRDTDETKLAMSSSCEAGDRHMRVYYTLVSAVMYI